MSQGQGPGTARKEDGFAAVFAVGLAVSKGGSAKGYPYWHLDMHAGCGVNVKANCDGSPLVFVRKAQEAKREFRGYFCDQNLQAVQALRDRLGSMGLATSTAQANWMRSDNFIRHMAWLIKEHGERPSCAVGSVLYDPNGWDAEGYEALKEFSLEYKRIDLVINVNIGLMRMALKCDTLGHPGFAGWPSIETIAGSLNKKHWIIRNLGYQPGMQFSILVGRNIEAGLGRYKDFHPLASPVGREIMKTLGRVPDEQGGLFGKAS